MRPIRFVSFALACAVASATASTTTYWNTDFITHLGIGAGGADLSVVRPSGAILGWGAFSEFSALDSFSITGSRGQLIDRIVIYAYQRNSGTDPTINNLKLQIWDSDPRSGTAQVVWGDLATNLLSDASFTGVYRTLNATTNALNTARPIMELRANVSLVLQPGTYFLQWTMAGTADEGVVFIPSGTPASGNAFQYNASTSTYANLVDAGQGIELPFSVRHASVPNPITLTQGEWTAKPKKSATGVLEDRGVTFPVSIGTGNRGYAFTSANAVRNFLPCAGTPRALSSGGVVTNPTRTKDTDNTFAGQLLAAVINANANVGLAEALLDSSCSELTTAQRNYLNASPVITTVQELIARANLVLAGDRAANKNEISILTSLLDLANKSWPNGVQRTPVFVEI
jgi:hypothetical protein